MLLVDDDVHILETNERFLRRKGYEMYQARTADFSTLEFDLLAFLARHPGQVFSYEQLHNRVWRAG